MTQAKILITSGATREYIDAVRYISNHSTGELGALLCDAFAAAKWDTTLVLCKGAMAPKQVDRCLDVVSAQDAYETIDQCLQAEKFDAAIHLMGVADYAPIRKPGKISSYHDELVIDCQPTKKILPLFKQYAPQTKLVSFKLEEGIDHDELVARGLSSMRANDSDWVVVNQMEGIDDKNHEAFIYDHAGAQVVTCKSKADIAAQLVILLN